MTSIYKYCERIALSVALVGGLAVVGAPAKTRVQSRSDVRSAQQQLQSNGYYTGKVDGIDGPMTHRAIRKYQKDYGLAVTGRLDSATLNKLGVASSTMGKASRSSMAPGSQNMPATSGSQNMSGNPASSSQEANRSAGNNTGMNQNVSTSDIQAAQRALKQKGFYSGSIDGRLNQSTNSAIRAFQQSNGLNVTGQLDQNTLNSLGVTRNQ